MKAELSKPDINLLFEKSAFARPAIQEVVRMALENIDEGEVLRAGIANGYDDPHPVALERILTDVDTLLPCADAVVDMIARNACGRNVIFAARDGEMLSDLFSLRHPHHESALLPASMDLWESDSTNDPDLVVPFLADHGLDQRTVESGKALLVDTGFHGSIGKKIWDKMAAFYGSGIKDIYKSWRYYRWRLPIKLVAANKESWATTLVDLGKSPWGEWRAEHFPFSHTALYGPNTRKEWMNVAVATSMQLLPRYHGPFTKLEREDEKVTVLCSEPQRNAKEEESEYDPDIIMATNSSVVNAVAAACVQLRVARHSLGLPATERQEIITHLQ